MIAVGPSIFVFESWFLRMLSTRLSTFGLGGVGLGGAGLGGSTLVSATFGGGSGFLGSVCWAPADAGAGADDAPGFAAPAVRCEPKSSFTMESLVCAVALFLSSCRARS